MLVGSLNAAHKFTIGRGKMQKLSGLIITKNIDPEKQKIPAKIVEGRVTWLNMRMDPEYELEEMDINMENMFDHVNSMTNTDMPRDFLASLSKHFFRTDGEKYSSFQKFQTEACLVVEQRRPHWRKRKTISSSNLLTMFYILEKEVIDSEDQVAKQLFVEIFHSREAYTDSVMKEFDETDKLEKRMMTGTTFKVPGFDDDISDSESERFITESFNVSNFCASVADVVESETEHEKTKYLKIFEKDGDYSLGVHNTRMKALAKRKSKSIVFPKIDKDNVQGVKFGTKTFTRIDSTSSIGAANTSAGYCTLIDIKVLSDEVRTKLLSLLNREDLLGIEISTCTGNEFANISNEDNDELLASQDFPTMFQSQTTQTLLHCNICEFLCRSKPQFEEHVSSHPSCNICKKTFLNEDDLGVHDENEHQQQVIRISKS